jgi:hypothetical protein
LGQPVAVAVKVTGVPTEVLPEGDEVTPSPVHGTAASVYVPEA